MNYESSAVVIDLAKRFVELTAALDLNWSKAFCRFCQDGPMCGSSASYVAGSQVALVDPFENSRFFDDTNAKCQRLLKILGKDRAVVLLTVDSKLGYDVKFEYENMDRWRITKLNGGTGMPAGLSYETR
jgi:hypothetical protein